MMHTRKPTSPSVAADPVFDDEMSAINTDLYAVPDQDYYALVTCE
jgi:hypothetical protein